MSSEKVPTNLKEHFSRDAKSFKELKGKSRFYFIWDYYKLPITFFLVFLLVAGVAGRLLWEGQRPCRLRACVVLNTEADSSAWFDSFTEELKEDGNPGAVDVNLDQPFDYDNQYYYIQELEVMTTISSYRMDIAICNADLYSYLLALNACLPLDTGLPSDLYDTLLADGRIDHTIANLQIHEDGQTHAEEGIEGDYGILLNDTEFTRLYNQPQEAGAEEEPLYAVIISNTEHTADCVTLIKALLK